MMPMPITVQSQANRFAMSRRCAPTACPMRRWSVLNAVACHVAEALGADAEAVGRDGHRAEARDDTDEQHLRRREGRTLSGQRCTHPPEIAQAGGGDAPAAGLSDAKRAVPQQQDAQRQQTADGRGKRCAKRAPGTSRPAPQTVTLWPKSCICRVGLMRKKLNTTSSTQTSTLIRLGVRASPVARSMAAYIPIAIVKGRAADQMAK